MSLDGVGTPGSAPAVSLRDDGSLATAFTRQVGIEVPLICGPMYPCSNPELVAAVSEAGGLGVYQPVSLTYVHGHGYREGIRLMRRLTAKPIGMNAPTLSSGTASLPPCVCPARQVMPIIVVFEPMSL